MGYESYNFDVKLLGTTSIGQVKRAITRMGYTICEDGTFEKALAIGFIEIEVQKKYISVRTAKANDPNIISEIIKDIDELNNAFQIDAFDLQLKQSVLLEQLNEVMENFKRVRNEYHKYYPNIKYPIRCNDVYKELSQIEKNEA